MMDKAGITRILTPYARPALSALHPEAEFVEVRADLPLLTFLVDVATTDRAQPPAPHRRLSLCQP